MVDLRLLRVIRPHIVAGGFLGYLAGALFSLNMGGAVSWTGFILGYLIVLFMDLSTHFNNDYFDVEIDRNASFKPFGSVNQFIEHPELRSPALVAAAGCSVLSMLLASGMVLAGSAWHMLAVVGLFNLLGWLYSAPPVSLHSRRLGEATIAVGTGFCVPAVGYVAAHGSLDGGFTLFSAPLVLYGFILALCLQVPDYEVDRAMGKNTVVGLIGRRRTYLVVLACAVASTVTCFRFFPAAGFLRGVQWASLIPAASSLLSVLFLSGSPEHARVYTMVNVSALFVFLSALDIILLLVVLPL